MRSWEVRAMEDKTFIVRGEWLDNINTLPMDLQDKIIAEVVRYGTRRELQYEADPVVFSMVNMLKGRIDASINAYEEKVEKSKTAGRKKKYDNQQIYDLARSGKTAEEVAAELGCSKSTIDKSEGWKNRKLDGFVF